jgi:hypothetical protein
LNKASLKPEALKDWLHKTGLTQSDKLLLMLATFDEPVSIASILARGEEAGLRKKVFSNPSAILGRMGGMAIRTPKGWEITDTGRQRLYDLGVSDTAPAVLNVAKGIREHAAEVHDEQTREFLNEAIRCFEYGLLRSAVVMSWLAAVYVLQLYVEQHRLVDFNAEAVRVDSRWKAARTIGELGRMKESDFLDRLVGISVLDKNVKSALQRCLDLRNACGHPTSMKVGVNTVAAHIETLLLNVFARFS